MRSRIHAHGRAYVSERYGGKCPNLAESRAHYSAAREDDEERRKGPVADARFQRRVTS